MMSKVCANRNIGIILLATFIALFSACTDTGLFLPTEEEAPRVEILMVESGTVLVPEDTVSIEIIFDGDDLEVDLMVIDLLDSAEELLYSQELGPEEIQALPTPVIIPDDLETGLYVLDVSLYLVDELVAEKSAQIYVASEPHIIHGVVSYPEILYPGGRGLVRAGIEVPESGNPYLRWRSSDGIIAEGYLADGLDEIEVDVPDREGVFTLSLELFPLTIPLFEPPSVEIFSSNQFDLQLFVSADQPGEPHELGPAENYATLFHFRGEMVDRGREAADEPVSTIGTIGLGIGDESFGLVFDEASGMIVDRSVIPHDDESIHPFTLSVRGVFERFGMILSVRDSAGELFAALEVDEDGYPKVSISGVESSMASFAVPLNETVELTVSVIPGEEQIRFLWFLSGYPAGDESIDISEAIVLPDFPYTTIGGESGIRMVIDELGVFSVETEVVDSAVYARAMRLEYGSDLLYAEGFDGVSFPDELVLESESEEPLVERGAAVIPVQARIELPSIPIDFSTLSIEVIPGLVPDEVSDASAGEEPGGEPGDDLSAIAGVISIDAFIEVKSEPSLGRIVRFESDTGYISSDDELLFGVGEEFADEQTEPSDEDTYIKPIRVDLAVDAGTFSLLLEEELFELGTIPYSDASLVITIGALDVTPVTIDSILITKNRLEHVSTPAQ